MTNSAGFSSSSLSKGSEYHVSLKGYAQSSDSANNLGNGIGRIARAFFNYFSTDSVSSSRKYFPQSKRSIEQVISFPAEFNLTTLDGTNGFKVEGLKAGDGLGWSVSHAGDLNGDGKAEVVLGTYFSSPGGRISAGTAYVIFGQANGWSAAFNLTTLNGSNGFKVEGLSANDQLGYAVSAAGDLNGDGLQDLVLGTTVGRWYLLFGNANGWPAAFDLTTLNGVNGFKIEGPSGDNYLGSSVSTAGDLNGDGITDLVLGAKSASPGNRTQAGIAYVVLGQSSGWPAVFNLTTLNGSNGFKVEGLNANDHLGISVSRAGDINGDGKEDLLLGADNASPGGRASSGVAYVLLGQAGGWSAAFDLATLNGTNGFKIEGLNAGDHLGLSLSTAGDLNGDGKGDFALGARAASPGGRNLAGTAYVVFGNAIGWGAAIDLTTLNGANGFKVEGLNANDQLGKSVSTAGDLNGDGVAELVIGAVGASPAGRFQAGTVYVLLGKADGWMASFDLATLNGGNGFKLEGLGLNGYLGTSVSTAGDLNGDGMAELILGADGVSRPGSSNIGTAYVIFGSNKTFATITPSNELFSGSPPQDQMFKPRGLFC